MCSILHRQSPAKLSFGKNCPIAKSVLKIFLIIILFKSLVSYFETQNTEFEFLWIGIALTTSDPAIYRSPAFFCSITVNSSAPSLIGHPKRHTFMELNILSPKLAKMNNFYVANRKTGPTSPPFRFSGQAASKTTICLPNLCEFFSSRGEIITLLERK